MRYFALLGLLASVLSGRPAAAAEQPRHPTLTPRQEGLSPVRVGFPTGAAGLHQFKTGCWTPVSVDLAYEDQNDKPRPVGRADGDLVVESPDSDEMLCRYAVPWPSLQPGEKATVLLYTRPGKEGGDITVSVRDAAGRVLQTAKAARDGQRELPPSAQFYLLAGMPVPEPLKKATQALAQTRSGQRDATSTLGTVTAVEELPDEWFGYAAVDGLILTTGNADFLKGLLGSNAKRKALEEWVRRGGRLVLSTGANQQLVRELLTKVPLLKATLQGGERTNLPEVSDWTPDPTPLQGVPIAVLKPFERGANVDVLLQGAKARPLIVQAPCGIGRVVLVAFDLDGERFTGWGGQEKFWTKLLRELEPRAIQNPASQNTELVSQVVDSLESFGDRVPVVYFGWVALFILVYILVVGPLDYFFLKKVVKRLELTWVTFPAIVLAVSLAAYFTAVRIKGSDLLVNKIDVIDILAEAGLGDRGGPEAKAAEAYGTTWFTLFSPRIQHYTLGVEPASPGWVTEGGPLDYSVALSDLGKPESLYGGTSRSGSLGLFRKDYEYARTDVHLERGGPELPPTAGLLRATIPVWAAKTFTASWRAPRGAGQPAPLFRSRLQAKPEAEAQRSVLPLTGYVKSELPAELKDAALFYQGSWYSLGNLPPGATRELNPAKLPDGGVSKHRDDWFHNPWWDTDRPVGVAEPRAGGSPASPARRYLKTLLFHRDDRSPAMAGLRNSTVRHLDQTWRLGRQLRVERQERQEEAVLVGRLAPKEGEASEIDKAGLSPTRLWLGRLPGDPRGWDPPDGTFTQETFVRVYLPVARSQ